MRLIQWLCLGMVCLQLPAVYSADLPFRARANQYDQGFWKEVDVKAEILLGRKVASRILGEYPLYNNPNSQRYINLLGQGIASLVGREDLTYYFAILDSDHINAYAAPGGYIFVTKGLLDACENEAQLVGVLSHEISHVNRRYIVKKYGIRGSQASLLSFASIMIGGTTQTARLSLNMMVEVVMDEFFNKGLDQKEELAADQDAVQMMSDLNYDPKVYEALISELESKGTQNHLTDYKKGVSDTHPSTQKRVANIQQAYSDLQKPGKYIRKRRFNTFLRP